MLYRLHNNILIIGLLTLGVLIALSASRAFCAMTVVTVIAFATQLLLLLFYLRGEGTSYSDKSLFFTVFVYSLCLATLIFITSYYYNDEKFLFDDPDAVFYYEEGLKATDFGFFENAKRIILKNGFDDWGALLLSNLMMSLIPSSFFMNVLYLFTGAVSSVMLYRVGKHFMPDVYAFVASLAYGTSSYLILFHCTYLKESFFVFLVVCTIYYFYRFITDESCGALIGVLASLFLIIFFRPAVVAFLLMAFTLYYAITKRGSAISLFLYIAIAVGLVVSMAFLQSQMDHYTEGGDTDALLAENGSANYSGGFNFFVAWFVSLFGPFPTLFPMESAGPVPMIFYGAGLMYKLFLIIPLWTGVFFAVKRTDFLMIPMMGFTLIEIAASAYVMASFELRKVLLHMPFIYPIAFYGIYQLGTIKKGIAYQHLSEMASYALAIGILFLWNVIRVKG